MSLSTASPAETPARTAPDAFLAPDARREPARSRRAPAPGSGPPEQLPGAARMLDGYRPAIYGFLRRKGFSAEEADDLTQETLIRAYLHLAGFRGVTMTAWLYRIAGNVAVDHLRKQRFVTVPLECLPLLDSGEEDPAVCISRTERRREVMSVVEELPECHRRVLLLRFFEERSLAEIAAAMNCTPMAAKLRVFRAVSALRRRCRAEPGGRERMDG